MSGKLLQIHHLNLDIGEIDILRKVSLVIDKGESVGLVGESGSGKSMMALSIMGLLPKSANVKGSILFNRVNLLTLSERERAKLRGKTMAMIFQDPLASLNPLHRIGKQISEMLDVHGRFNQPQKQQRLEELMKQVELAPELGIAISPSAFGWAKTKNSYCYDDSP